MIQFGATAVWHFRSWVPGVAGRKKSLCLGRLLTQIIKQRWGNNYRMRQGRICVALKWPTWTSLNVPWPIVTVIGQVQWFQLEQDSDYGFRSLRDGALSHTIMSATETNGGGKWGEEKPRMKRQWALVPARRPAVSVGLWFAPLSFLSLLKKLCPQESWKRYSQVHMK